MTFMSKNLKSWNCETYLFTEQCLLGHAGSTSWSFRKAIA